MVSKEIISAYWEKQEAYPGETRRKGIKIKINWGENKFIIPMIILFENERQWLIYSGQSQTPSTTGTQNLRKSNF